MELLWNNWKLKLLQETGFAPGQQNSFWKIMLCFHFIHIKFEQEFFPSDLYLPFVSFLLFSLGIWWSQIVNCLAVLLIVIWELWATTKDVEQGYKSFLSDSLCNASCQIFPASSVCIYSILQFHPMIFKHQGYWRGEKSMRFLYQNANLWVSKVNLLGQLFYFIFQRMQICWKK